MDKKEMQKQYIKKIKELNQNKSLKYTIPVVLEKMQKTGFLVS